MPIFHPGLNHVRAIMKVQGNENLEKHAKAMGFYSLHLLFVPILLLIARIIFPRTVLQANTAPTVAANVHIRCAFHFDSCISHLNG